MEREATKVVFCPTGTRDLLHERWREEGRKEARFGEGEGEWKRRRRRRRRRPHRGLAGPAAPSGTRHERHFYSDRKSDSGEQWRRDRKNNGRRTNIKKKQRRNKRSTNAKKKEKKKQRNKEATVKRKGWLAGTVNHHTCTTVMMPLKCCTEFSANENVNVCFQ